MAGIRSRAVGTSEWIEHKIDDDVPMTFICHQGDVRVEPIDQIPITPEMTVYHGQRVIEIDPVAQAWAEYILGYKLENMFPIERHISEAHVIGLCDLPLKLMQQHKRLLPFFIQEPETYLHPSQQARIARWLVVMINSLKDDGSFDVYPENEI